MLPYPRAHVCATLRTTDLRPGDLPPERDAGGLRRSRRRGRRPGHPLRGPGGPGHADRSRQRRLAAPGARGRLAAAAHHDHRRCGQRDRDALRPGPHQRPALRRQADHGQGDGLDRGLPLLRARCARPQGHAARARDEPDQRQRAAGWLLDHPAAGQAVPGQRGRDRCGEGGGDRGDLRPQDQGAALRHRTRAGALQGLDPRALPEHRLLRRRGVRHPGGGAALLRRERLQAHPASVGAARRAGQEPRGLQPHRLPRPRHRASRRRPRTGWPSSG